MVTEKDKKRLRLLASLKNKPELALFQVVQDVKQDIAHELALVSEKIKEIVKKELTEQIKDSIFKGVKKIKGDQGDKGDKGDKPVAGIDYHIPKDGKDAKPAKDGKDGKDGKSIIGPPGPPGPYTKGGKGEEGKKGDPGSPDTPKEIKNKLERLKGDDRLDAFAIKNLKQFAEQTVLVGGDRGRRVWRKDGVSPTGAIDGTNATFTLPSIMKPETDHVFVNGIRQRRGSSYDYTVASNYKQVVFVVGRIPPTNSEILIDYEED